MNTRKTVLVALMACLALGIYALESIVPPIVPIPGVKLGLANVVTLVAIYVLGCRAAFATLLIRIVLSSLLFGQAMSFCSALQAECFVGWQCVLHRDFSAPLRCGL